MIKKIAVSFTLSSMLLMGASPLIVSDPENTASNATMIGHFVDSIAKYEDMISKAQEQIKTLGGISDIMNKTSNLLNNTNLTIANPLELIKTLQEEMARIERSAKRLKNSFQNYNFMDHIKSKRIQKRCPWLKFELISPQSMSMFFTDKGEEDPVIKDAKALFEILSDDAYSNLKSLAGSLSGRALGEFLCEKAIEDEQTKKIEQTQAQVKRAILEGDKDLAIKKRLQLFKETQEFQKKRNERERERWQPLVNRNQQFIEQMGVTDASFNSLRKDGVKYCQEGVNEDGDFCYPILLRSDAISDKLNKEYESFQNNLMSAKNDTNALAKAYTEYQQKTQPLVLEYLRNIAESLNFLNTTTSFYSSLFAEDYRKRYGSEEKQDIDNDAYDTEKEVLEGVETGLEKIQVVEKDQYGFPMMTSGKSEETRMMRAKNEYGL